MASLTPIAPEATAEARGGFVRVDDLDRLMTRLRTSQYRTIWAALAAVVALQIAGPAGLAGQSILPGPAWLYPLLAVAFLAVAVAVRWRADTDLLAMDINSVKLRGLRQAAEQPLTNG